MIGLDTNVLVRYIVRDDPAQTALADRCIEHRCSRERPGYVSHLVLAELVWVLGRGYGYPRQMLADVLGTLLSSEEIRIQDAPLVRAALGEFSAGAADFADCLIPGVILSWLSVRFLAKSNTYGNLFVTMV